MSELASATDPEERLVKLIHDLRTPLTVVSGFAELLARDYEKLTSERRAEYVSRIASGAREMREVLDGARFDDAR